MRTRFKRRSSQLISRFQFEFVGKKRFDFASIRFRGIPSREGKNNLGEGFDLNDNFASSAFSFSIGGETVYEDYEKVFVDEGFVEITNLDTRNGIVEG